MDLQEPSTLDFAEYHCFVVRSRRRHATAFLRIISDRPPEPLIKRPSHMRERRHYRDRPHQYYH